jgi:peptidoglycan hydrolase-like protein with peptidoglycan-binding domain
MRPAESFIGQPIRSLQTMLRVIAEYDGSVTTIVPDGIYGPETIKAVTLFQQGNALPPTGVTDQQTWDAIVAKYDDAFISIHKAAPIEIIWDANRIFMIGDRSPYIYLAQSMLIFLSQVDGSIRKAEHNGALDSATSEAIADFQRLNDLPDTGLLDKKTWKHLSKQFTLHANRAENQLL